MTSAGRLPRSGGSTLVLTLLLVLALLAVPANADPIPDLTLERDAEQAGSTPPDRIHPTLRQQLERAGGPVEALVVLDATPDLTPLRGDRAAVVGALRDTAAHSQAGVRTLVERRGSRVLNSFWISNMLLVEADAGTLEAVSRMPGVARVVPNFEVTIDPQASDVSGSIVDDRTWGIDRIGAHQVWSGLGIDGAGVRVATLDTGVDIAHPDLAGKMVSDDPGDPAHPGGWMEFDSAGNPVGSQPHDSQYHGTHVSGTIHGGSTSGVSIGVAPGAEMMHGLVIPGGGGSFAQVAAGMQWAIAPFDATGAPAGRPADVVNMSLGGNGLHEEMIAPTRNMYFAGVFPAFAIGNNCGSRETASPGNVYEAVGVGATDDTDTVASFSCGGVVEKADWTNPPAEWPDTYVKPDLSAPGVGTYSASPGGGYRTLQGTSMATPHVAGSAALMRQAASALTVDEMLDVFGDTAFFDDRHGAERPNTRFGRGRIDTLAAVTLVAYDSGVEGTVTDAATGAPLAGAEVTVASTGASVPTGPDGSFQLRLAPGGYALEISRFGYVTATVEVEVVADAFTTVDVGLEALPTGDIAGTVTYAPSGNGIPGVSVDLLGVPIPFGDETAVDGTYAITGVPEGTYQVRATVAGLPDPDTAEVTVVAGTTATLDFSVERPARVALIGDYGNQIQEFLAGHGIVGEDHNWSSLGDVGQYSAVVISYATDPGQADFNAFLAATDAAGTGVMFLDQAFGTHQGIRLLSRHTGMPESRSHTTSTGGSPSYYQVTDNTHALTDAYAVGDQIDHDIANSSAWSAWFDGYYGEGRQVLADLGRTDSTGIRGHGIGVQQRPSNRHVLLSSHGVSVTRGPEDWSAESAQLFLDALAWVSPPSDEPEARFALWDLEAQPDVILGGEDVNVSVSVKNIGDLAGDYTATLYIDGAVEATRTVTLDPDAHTQLGWTVTRPDIGTYTVSVGPLSTSFRVRPPRVTVEADALDGSPLDGARVELVTPSAVSGVGTTDADGRLTFESTDAVASYTIGVRRSAVGDEPAYLLTRALTVDRDVTVTFAPTTGTAVRADLALEATGSDHTATAYLAGEHTDRWAFAFEPGTVVLTPGQYRARVVHTVDDLAAAWWYPTAMSTLDWSQPGTVTHQFGGAFSVSLADIHDQEAPDLDVDWDVVDAYGTRLATVLQAEIRPFAGDVVDIDTLVDDLRAVAAREHPPVLRLTAPGGEDLRAGGIPWDDRPFTFAYDVADVRQGVHDLSILVDTGPYSDRLTAAATLVIPARTLSATTIAAGDEVEVSVVFDVSASEGDISLTEVVPDGFTISDWSATPRVIPKNYADGTWTWTQYGRSVYRVGDLLTVTYTLQADAALAPGTYALSGVATHHGAGLARAVAGPWEITVE